MALPLLLVDLSPLTLRTSPPAHLYKSPETDQHASSTYHMCLLKQGLASTHMEGRSFLSFLTLFPRGIRSNTLSCNEDCTS